MTKKAQIVLFLVCISFRALAQQDPMYSLYMFNPLIINPAYAGTREVLNASLLYRNQWANIPGAPNTGIVTVDAPLENQRVGLGMNAVFDKIGVTNYTGLTGIYSYKIKFEQSFLTFGLQAGVGFYYSNFSSVDYSDGGSPDVAFQNDFHDVLPHIGFGMYYTTDRFYAGLSIPQIAGYSIQNALYHSSESSYLDLANHLFLSSGYKFDLTQDIQFKPSVLIKYVSGAPIEFDINAVVSLYDIMALGVSYRSLASINFLSQIRVTRQIFIGYAYEYSTTNLSTFSNGSHEFMLQYYFDFSHAKVITPRFF